MMVADIDDGSNSLEAADVAATSGDSRWYVNNDGHVVNSSVGLSAWTWNASDKTLRNFLGFTGNETTTTVNGYTVLTAENPCFGVLVPSRPYQQNHISVENVAQSRRKIGGGYTSNYIGTYRDSILGFDLDARLDQIDLYQHFIHNFVPLCSQGERVNFYQVWGDSRRSLITADANADQPAHDLVYTSSRNGFEGRIRGSMKSNEYNLMFPNNMRRRVPVNMRIEHLLLREWSMDSTLLLPRVIVRTYSHKLLLIVVSSLTQVHMLRWQSGESLLYPWSMMILSSLSIIVLMEQSQDATSNSQLTSMEVHSSQL
jgi:hypothetical protein